MGRRTKEFVGGLVRTISQNIVSAVYGVPALSLSVTPDYTPKPRSVQHKLYPSINKSKVQVVRQTTIPGVVMCEHSYVESDGRVHHC